MRKPVFVTQSVVPGPAEYTAHIMRILDSRRLTKIGNYAVALEKQLRAVLGIPHFLLCANGTLSLQPALRAANQHVAVPDESPQMPRGRGHPYAGFVPAAVCGT